MRDALISLQPPLGGLDAALGWSYLHLVVGMPSTDPSVRSTIEMLALVGFPFIGRDTEAPEGYHSTPSW